MKLQRGGETQSEDDHYYWGRGEDEINLDHMLDIHDFSVKASSFTMPQQFHTCIDEKRIMGLYLKITSRETIVGNDALQSHHQPTNYTDTQQQIWTLGKKSRMDVA